MGPHGSSGLHSELPVRGEVASNFMQRLSELDSLISGSRQHRKRQVFHMLFLPRQDLGQHAGARENWWVYLLGFHIPSAGCLHLKALLEVQKPAAPLVLYSP